jgi:asparagine synthase (glutamine-hydrolysing)
MKRFVSAAPLELPARHRELEAIFPWYRVRQLLARDPGSALLDAAEEHFAASGSNKEIEQVLFVNQTGALPDILLTELDRSSMAAGLQVRTPFLDSRLYDYVQTIPAQYLLRGNKGADIFKQALRGTLSDEIINHRTQQAPVPLHAWFQNELSEYTHDLLGKSRLAADGHLKGAEIGKLLREHTTSRGEQSERLWSLLTLEQWYRSYC